MWFVIAIIDVLETLIPGILFWVASYVLPQPIIDVVARRGDSAQLSDRQMNNLLAGQVRTTQDIKDLLEALHIRRYQHSVLDALDFQLAELKEINQTTKESLATQLEALKIQLEVLTTQREATAQMQSTALDIQQFLRQAN